MNRERFIELLLSNPGKFVGVTLGLIVGILLITVGIIKTILLILVVLLGLSIGARFDRGEDVVGYLADRLAAFINIFNKK